MNGIILIIENEVRKGFPIVSKSLNDKLELSFTEEKFIISLNGVIVHSFADFEGATKKFRTLSDEMNLPSELDDLANTTLK